MHFLLNTVKDIESDFGLQLICTETEKTDTLETQTGFGDTIRYHLELVKEVTAYAHGFKWEHPHGGVISGNFGKPIEIAVATYDEGGDEIQFEHFRRELARAIVKKLGNVAEIDAEILALAAPAPDLTKLDWSFLNADLMARA